MASSPVAGSLEPYRGPAGIRTTTGVCQRVIPSITDAGRCPMEIYGFTLCAVTMWLDRKLHDAFYDLEFISDDQQMLSVLFSASMTYG